MTNEELIDVLLRAIPKASSVSERSAAEASLLSGLKSSSERPMASDEADSSLSTVGDVLSYQLASLTREVAEGRRTSQANTEGSNSMSRGDLASKIWKSINGGAVASVFKLDSQGIGLLPILAGLKGLFGRDRVSEPEFPSYIAPPAINVDAGLDSSGAIQPISRGVAETPRPIATGASAPLPSVTIQVNTMDSRSFMDHSAEIAGAVRQAILSGHGINEFLME